jgi:hypothetical protein
MGVSIGDTRDIDEICTVDWKLFADDLNLSKKQIAEILREIGTDFVKNQQQVSESLAPYDSDGIISRILDDASPRIAQLLS